MLLPIPATVEIKPQGSIPNQSKVEILPFVQPKDEILPAVLQDRVAETASIEQPPSNEDEQQVEKEEVADSTEDKLELVRARISSKLDRIRETAVLLSAQRKELGRRRRKAMEDVNSASEKYKELERELEEACEAEDFERAEKVSESLAEKEKEKDGLLGELRDAELECNAVEAKMQEVLESQIAAEEEGAALLEQFAKVWGLELSSCKQLFFFWLIFFHMNAFAQSLVGILCA